MNMTQPVFNKLFKGEGGRFEFVFTIEGLPFGFCSSPSIVDNISNSRLATLFGSRYDSTYSASGFFAYDCKLFPFLSEVSSQKISSDPTKGIEIEDLSITIDNDHPGQDWSQWFPSSSILNGFPTINFQLHPRTFPDVKYGTLERSFLKGDNEIYFYDKNGLITHLVDNLPCFLWLGRECVFARSVVIIDSSEKLYRANLETTPGLGQTRGVFRSVDSSHYTKAYDSLNSAVTSHPVGTVAGKTGYLWGIPVSEDGADIGTPNLLHMGRISTNASLDQTKINIAVSGWTKQLETPFRINQVTSSIRGYHLSRGAEGTDIGYTKDTLRHPQAAPHILITEYSDIEGEWVHQPIWLCEKNSSVYYDTLDELINAINYELAKCGKNALGIFRNTQTSGDGTTGNPRITLKNGYYISDEGMICLTDIDTFETISGVSVNGVGPSTNRGSGQIQIDTTTVPYKFYWKGPGNQYGDYRNIGASGTYTLVDNQGHTISINVTFGSVPNTGGVAAYEVKVYRNESYIAGQLPILLNLGQRAGGIQFGEEKLGSKGVDIDEDVASSMCTWNILEAYGITDNSDIKMLDTSLYLSPGYIFDSNPKNAISPNLIWGRQRNGSFKDNATHYFIGSYNLYTRSPSYANTVGYEGWNSGGYEYKAAGKNFIWPLDPNSGTHRLRLTNKLDTSVWQSGTRFGLGNGEISSSGQVTLSQEKSNSDTKSPSFALGYLGTGMFYSTSKNYSYFDLGTTQSAGKPTGTYPSLKSFDSGVWFQFYHTLYWLPSQQENDPWVFQSAYNSEETEDLEEIFLGLFGDDSRGLYFPINTRIDDIVGALGDDADMDSVIDWESFSDTFKKLTDDHKYKLPYTFSYGKDNEKIKNVLELLNSEAILHGVQMTYEFDRTSNPPMFRIRFKRANEFSLVEPILENRFLTSQDFLAGDVAKMAMNYSWIYGQMQLKCNYDGKANNATITVNMEDGLETLGGKSRTLMVDSKLSQIPEINQAISNEELFSLVNNKLTDTILSRYSVPIYNVTQGITLRPLGTIGIGSPCIVSDDTVIDPYTGQTGISNQPGVVNSMTINWNDATGSVNYSIAPFAERGISPSAKTSSARWSQDQFKSDGYANITCEDNEYVLPSSGRTDLSCFDCLGYNRFEDEYIELDCGCGDYAVKTYEYNSNTTEYPEGIIQVTDPAGSQGRLYQDPYHYELEFDLNSYNYRAADSMTDYTKNIDVSNDAYLYYGNSSGLHKYNGSSFSQPYSTTKVKIVSCYDGGVLYSPTDGSTFDEIRRHTDAGANSSLGIFALYSVTSVHAHSQSSTDWLYASGDTVYRYSGSGTVWNPIGSPSSGNNVTEVSSYGNWIIAACADGDVYRWSSGTTWVSIGLKAAHSTTYIRRVASIDGGSLYAIDGGSVYRYNGSSWTQLDNPVPEAGWVGTVTHIFPLCGYIFVGWFNRTGTAFTKEGEASWNVVHEMSFNRKFGGGAMLGDRPFILEQEPIATGHAIYEIDFVEPVNDLVIFFSDSKSTALQSCQRDWWTFYADSDNLVLDQDSVGRLGERID
jgi:hypothetical protein